MNKALATITLIILDALAFSAAVWATFGSSAAGMMGDSSELAARILLLAALPFPLIFVYRLFRRKYGFTMRKFLLCSLLPPYIVSITASVILLSPLGPETQGWGGLVMLSVIVAWHLVTLGLMFSAAVWISLDQVFEYIKHYEVRKTFSIILLILCGAAIGNGLHLLLFQNTLPTVSIVIVSNTSAGIGSYITKTLVKAGIEAVPAGIGAAALARFYRNEYSVKPAIFMLCAFLPTFLISGGLTAAEYFNHKKYFPYHSESFDNLLFAAAILTVTVIIYAVSSAVRRKKSY